MPSYISKSKKVDINAASYLTFNTFNPEEELEQLDFDETKIEIKIKPRKKKKYICTVIGLNFSIEEIKLMLKYMKKELACNGHIINDENHGYIIQFQGNMKDKIKNILIESYNINPEKIIAD